MFVLNRKCEVKKVKKYADLFGLRCRLTQGPAMIFSQTCFGNWNKQKSKSKKNPSVRALVTLIFIKTRDRKRPMVPHTVTMTNPMNYELAWRGVKWEVVLWDQNTRSERRMHQYINVKINVNRKMNNYFLSISDRQKPLARLATCSCPPSAKKKHHTSCMRDPSIFKISRNVRSHVHIRSAIWGRSLCKAMYSRMVIVERLDEKKKEKVITLAPL